MYVDGVRVETMRAEDSQYKDEDEPDNEQVEMNKLGCLVDRNRVGEEEL
jgi:hypothetical protein